MNTKTTHKKIISSIFLLFIIGAPLIMQIFLIRNVLDYKDEIQNIVHKENEDLKLSNSFPQTLRVATSSGPDTLEPVDSWDSYSNRVLEQVIETLFARNLSDLELPLINRLAKSYWWENVLTLQIELKQGVLFHDNTPFNATAAKWNLDRLLYLTNCSGTNMGQIAHTQSLWMLPNGVTPIISHVAIIGEWNITITLNAPYAPLLDQLCYINAGMISPTAHAADVVDFLTISDIPVGTGPFKYVGYTPSVCVNFTRWDNYWREPAYFEKMIYVIFSDATIAHNAFLNYEIDINLMASATYIEQYETDENFTVYRFTDVTGKPSLVYQYLGVNNQKLNITWRRAIANAINYTYCHNELRQGNAIRSVSPISPGFGESYNSSIIPGVNGIPPNNGDIATARAIMQSMGYGVGFTTDDQWITVANSPTPFKTVRHTYNVGNAYREDLNTALTYWLSLLGIAVEDDAVLFTEFLNYLTNVPAGVPDEGWDHLELYAIGWGPDYLDPYNMLDPLFNPISSSNSAQVNDPTLNALMASALFTTDVTARYTIYKYIQWHIASNFFHIPIYHPRLIYVHLAEIQGVPYNAMESFYAYPIHRQTPAPFSLTSNAGVPDDDGIFNLTWSSSEGANNYSVYQSSSLITQINGNLTLLANEITNLSLALSGYSDGSYYFIVVAHNEYGDTYSNCINVVVDILYEHDLEVNLEVPGYAQVGSSYIINATVKNIGLNDETNIELFLFLDEIIVGSQSVPNLAIGENVTFQYEWTPTESKAYNFTAYAPPVLLEGNLDDNIMTKFVDIIAIKLFDGLYMKYDFTQYGNPSLVTNFTYSPYIGTLYYETFNIDYMGMNMSYPWIVDALTRIMSGGSPFGDGYHTLAWIFTDISLYDTIPIAVIGEGDHDFYVANELIYDLPGFGLVEVWVLEDLTEPGGLAWYEKSTGILLNGTFLFDGGVYNYTFDFIDTNAAFNYIYFDHDITVYLDIPSSIKINEIYLVNATVKNIGLNDETNVELYFYLDEVLIGSLSIPNLPVGVNQTIQYMWNPTEYRAYNFTAYAPSVLLESYEDNNRKTTFAYVIDSPLFDGLYMKYYFTQYGSPSLVTNFTYSPYTSRLYYEIFNMEYMGTHMSYTWIVDALTRIMSDGSPFGVGCHSPAWIFTDISLYDIIPIAVDGEGDHNFYVIDEIIYDLPGFGLVEVWVLEDLTEPGGIAWYEKSTGILLNGTFLFGGGEYNYTFNFIDTNAELNFLPSPPSPFVLTSNADSPDSDGIFDLTWTASSRAANYSIYRYSSLITEINGSLTLLADEASVLSLALSGYDYGTYYFIVVAHNNYGDTLSNCIKIDVENAKTLTITCPDFSSSWERNTAQYINWTSTGNILTIRIELYNNDAFVMEIISNTPNDGEFSWFVSSGLADSINYRIKIIDTSDPTIFDYSDPFEIKTPYSPPPGGIPGYDIFIILGLIAISVLFIARKKLMKIFR